MKQRCSAPSLLKRSVGRLLRCAFLAGVVLYTCLGLPLSQLSIVGAKISISYENTSGSAWAAPKKNRAKDSAKLAFKRGRDAFNNQRYVEALTAFEEAYRSYPLPLMLYNIANVYERLNLLPQALNKYQSFVATDQDKTGEAATKVQELKETLKGWVDVLISSQPTGAEIRLIDKRLPSLGQTPLTLRLPPQKQIKVFLTPFQGEAFSKDIILKSTPQSQGLNIKIPKKVAWVRVIGSPRQAKVKSGAVTASGLPALLKLSVGDHEIEVFKSDYLPIKRVVSLNNVHTHADPLTIQVDLKSNAGVALISLDVKTAGALLLIDGKPKGRSPFNEPFEVSEGEHQIELKGPEGQSFSELIVLRSGETANLEVNFEHSQSILSQDKLSIGLMSVGGASLLTGFVLGGVALSNASALEDCRAHQLCARRQGEIDRAEAVRTYALSADILMGLGLAISAAGGVLYWLDHQEVGPAVSPSTQTILSPLPGGFGVMSTITF